MTSVKVTAIVVAIAAVGLALFFGQPATEQDTIVEYRTKLREYMGEGTGKVPKPERRPNDWFFVQRAYPLDSIPMDQYYGAIVESKSHRAAMKMTPDMPTWQPAGPENIPGRVTALAVHPSDPNTIYAGHSSGGVHKSTDLGATWVPIFDSEGCPPIGDLTIDPTNPNIIYVGTGESCPSRSSYEGMGVYKSTDAGMTWTFSGLPNSHKIGRIIVDPVYPDNVYVAVFGSRFSGYSPDRGMYKSTDGGATWSKNLFIADEVGCIDLTLHPESGVMLAAMWQREDLGKQSGIWRSTDRGDTWSLISGTGGLPSTGAGRIGLCMEPTTGTAYALINGTDGAFDYIFKSADTGQTWTRTDDYVLADLNASWNGGWFFGQIRVAPGRPDEVYPTGYDAWRSLDGGDSYSNISSGASIWDVHVDQHALVILESNPDVLYLGNDGGVYYSDDRGQNWTHLNSMANDQFYAIEVDYSNPERLYGGAQDNGTMRTKTGNTDDWERVFGGDGFYCLVDPRDPDIIFCEYQYGSLFFSLDDGQSWNWGLDGINQSDPTNWCTPVVMDHNDPDVLYYGSNKVYRGVRDDYWLWWQEISPMLTFGTVTTIDAARTDNQVVYAGTSDGEVWSTTDGGANWNFINTGLPNRYVTRVTADWYDASVVYVCLSGYRIDGSKLPHIFRSEDYGATWTDISSNLPEAPVNDCIVDWYNDSTLYIASDVGVYWTQNLGASWEPFGVGMPIVPVHDLEYHIPTRAVIAGTYGRSMFRTVHPCNDENDADSDGIGDACDNCTDVANADQEDVDNDWIGDACDDCIDPDGDGYGNPGMPGATCADDNCPDVANADQADADSDGIGDACDECPNDAANDADGDGLCADVDNCPNANNPGQEDFDGDGVGDACCCGHYNTGFTGNADCSTDGKVTLTDITRLIDHVYISKAPLCCGTNGNANGSEDGKTTLADITTLIDHVYISKDPTSACP